MHTEMSWAMSTEYRMTLSVPTAYQRHLAHTLSLRLRDDQCKRAYRILTLFLQMFPGLAVRFHAFPSRMPSSNGRSFLFLEHRKHVKKSDILHSVPHGICPCGTDPLVCILRRCSSFRVQVESVLSARPRAFLRCVQDSHSRVQHGQHPH